MFPETRRSESTALNKTKPEKKTKIKSSQIPLSFDIDPSSGRDDLIQSQSVKAAISIVDQWPDWPSHIVILAGPTGAGKSHIASIWLEKSSGRTVSLETATDELVEQARLSPILIEDIDQSGFDETKLFHVLNAAREAGSSILMTTRIWPASWSIKLPDLASRIKAATTIEIGEPDELLLTQVIFKLFADRQIEIDEKIVNFLVLRMERSLAVAQEIVSEMDRIALSRKVPVGRNIAAEVLTMLEERKDAR